MADEKDSGWGSRNTGVTEDNQVVTSREGKGENEGQTVIGGGEKSGKQLDNAHDHYGPDTAKNTNYGNLDNAPDAEDYTSLEYQPGPNEK